MDNSAIVFYYAIFDNCDGTASLHMYGSQAELDAAILNAEKYDMYDMSEGGGSVTQAQIDALTQ